MTATVWEFRLQDWPGVVGGFVGRVERSRKRALTGGEKYAAALVQMGLPEGPIIEAEQVHGARVAVVVRSALSDRRPVALQLPGVDGLITDVRGVVLAIYVADCVAIFLHHRSRPGIGLAHAGWRGLAADIPGEMVQRALDSFGGTTEDLWCALSPCIEACCFEVGEEVAEHFVGIPGAVQGAGVRPRVDLRQVARARLQAAGVPPDHIRDLPGCTRCQPQRFASYRWDPERCGRNIALLALAPAGVGAI